MVLNIHIRKNDNGNLSAIFETEGRADWFNTLFEFAYRDIEGWHDKDEKWQPSWYFWLNHSYHASHKFVGERGVLPLQFFKDACRAKYFLFKSTMPDEVRIVKGGKYIGIKNEA